MSEAPVSLWAAVRRWAEAKPDATAVVSEAGAWSWAELAAWADGLAERLAGHGVGRGTPVAIMLPNCVEWVVTTIAAARLGALVVPVNVRYRTAELAGLLASARPRVIIATERFLTNPLGERIADALTELRGTPPAVLMVEGAADAEPFPRDVPPGAHPGTAVATRRDDLMIAYWTSGTTGAPKGVAHTNALLENVRNWTSLMRYGESDVLIAARPFYYVSGSCWALLGSLLHGAKLVIAQRFTAEEILRLMAAHGVTFLPGGPSLYEDLMASPVLAEVRGELRLERGFVGGAPLGDRLFARAARKLGIATIVNTYGMTELEGLACSTRLDDPPEVRERTSGRPLPGFAFELRDDTGRVITAADLPGRLYVRGRGLAGYLRDGMLTDPRDADGWFDTGDVLSVRPDGNWVFHRRVRDVAKVRGENVSLPDVDRELTALAGVRRAVCVAVPEPSGDRLEAVIEPEHGVELDPDALLAEARRRMAPFRVPRAVVIKPADATWPVTLTGKIRRDDVAALFTPGPRNEERRGSRHH